MSEDRAKISGRWRRRRLRGETAAGDDAGSRTFEKVAGSLRL
jgi:hypothetical protein